MTWEQMQQVVANCEDFCEMYGRMPYFYITGGDPILHPDFWPSLELLAIKKIPFTIMGNPFHLTDEVCQRMKRLGCEKYQLSIDVLEETHDWFRKPGSYQTTLEKIQTINLTEAFDKPGWIKHAVFTHITDKLNWLDI